MVRCSRSQSKCAVVPFSLLGQIYVNEGPFKQKNG